jgi:hypothetical protein
MKHYALLDTADKSCKARSMHGDPLGLEMNRDASRNKTTLLMARYLLARESAGAVVTRSPYAVMSSRIVTETNDYGKVFMYERGNAACLIPIIEDDGFECDTRKAFNAKYRALAGSQLHYISAADNPPLEPVNFDNCLKANTNKMMLSIVEEVITGVGIGSAIKGTIKFAAKGIRLWAINKSYKVMAVTGRAGGKAARYGRLGGAIGQYEETIIKLYEFGETAHDLHGKVQSVNKMLGGVKE